MPRLLLTALALLMAPAVSAQETAQPVRIEITKIDCSRLVRHYPRDDVAFRPGEGVGGRKVAPADLPGGGGMDVLPEVMEFTIAANPIGWGERIQAEKARAAGEAGQAAAIRERLAAAESLTALKAGEAKLTEAGVKLAQSLADRQAEQTVLENSVAAMEAEIAAGTRKSWDVDYHRTKSDLAAKEKQVGTADAAVKSNIKALEANAADQAARQATIDAAPAKEAKHEADRLAAGATLSGISARGLDSSTVTAAKVAYDTRRGNFTINGRPMGSEDQSALADACARRGVR